MRFGDLVISKFGIWIFICYLGFIIWDFLFWIYECSRLDRDLTQVWKTLCQVEISWTLKRSIQNPENASIKSTSCLAFSGLMFLDSNLESVMFPRCFEIDLFNGFLQLPYFNHCESREKQEVSQPFARFTSSFKIHHSPERKRDKLCSIFVFFNIRFSILNIKY